MTNNPNPLPLVQRLDDIGAHRHATNFFNLAAGNRLTIGYQGKCFQQAREYFCGRSCHSRATQGLRDWRTWKAKPAGDFTAAQIRGPRSALQLLSVPRE